MTNPAESVKRSFGSLSPQEALHVAIFIEERNAEIYREFAEMFAEFRDPESLEIAAAFWDMSNDERRHGSMLQERYFNRYGTRPCAATEDDIADLIEVPRLENGEIFTISKLRVGRSPRQMALEVAHAAEASAVRFYRGLAETATDPEMQAFYREFVDLESNHSDWLAQKITHARRTAGGTKRTRPE
jgi:rubrerythrin